MFFAHSRRRRLNDPTICPPNHSFTVTCSLSRSTGLQSSYPSPRASAAQEQSAKMTHRSGAPSPPARSSCSCMATLRLVLPNSKFTLVMIASERHVFSHLLSSQFPVYLGRASIVVLAENAIRGEGEQAATELLSSIPAMSSSGISRVLIWPRVEYFFYKYVPEQPASFPLSFGRLLCFQRTHLLKESIKNAREALREKTEHQVCKKSNRIRIH